MKGLGTPIKPIAGKLGIDEELVTVWTMSETTGSCLSASEMKASFSKRVCLLPLQLLRSAPCLGSSSLDLPAGCASG